MTDMEYVAAGERYIGLAVERLTLSDINGGYRIKYEAVIDAYRNAALRFQAGRRWMSAASAYVKCAQFQEKVRGSHEAAASYFTDAAEMYKRCDPASAEVGERAAPSGGRSARSNNGQARRRRSALRS